MERKFNILFNPDQLKVVQEVLRLTEEDQGFSTFFPAGQDLDVWTQNILSIFGVETLSRLYFYRRSSCGTAKPSSSWSVYHEEKDDSAREWQFDLRGCKTEQGYLLLQLSRWWGIS